MKIRFATTCLVIGTLLAPVVACADEMSTDLNHSETYVKDSVITAKIKVKLAEDKMRTLVNVSVGTDKTGAVFLTGSVRTPHDADMAVSIARATEGVSSVTSTLVVKPD